MLIPPRPPDTALVTATPLGTTTAPSARRVDSPGRRARGPHGPLLLAAALLLLTGAAAAAAALRADTTPSFRKDLLSQLERLGYRVTLEPVAA